MSKYTPEEIEIKVDQKMREYFELGAFTINYSRMCAKEIIEMFEKEREAHSELERNLRR